jgi:hypothetical protein
MMQYLLPTATSPHKNSEYLEQARGRTFSESSVSKSKLQNPLPPLSSSMKTTIPPMDKPTRLSGARRERRSADDAAAFSHGTMDARQVKASPVGNSAVPQQQMPPMSISQRTERNLAASTSTARFPSNYTTPIDGPALFSASDLMNLLKGGDKSGSGSSR